MLKGSGAGVIHAPLFMSFPFFVLSRTDWYIAVNSELVYNIKLY